MKAVIVIENGNFILSLTPQSKLEEKVIEDLTDVNIDVKASFEYEGYPGHGSKMKKHIIKISKKIED